MKKSKALMVVMRSATWGDFNASWEKIEVKHGENPTKIDASLLFEIPSCYQMWRAGKSSN